MDHQCKPGLLEQSRHGAVVSEIYLPELKTRILRERVQTMVLERYIVVVINAIDANNVTALLQ